MSLRNYEVLLQLQGGASFVCMYFVDRPGESCRGDLLVFRSPAYGVFGLFSS